MPRRVDYLFTLLSPWAYLGFETFHALARRHALVIHYRPVMLGEVFSETGGLPLARRHPARQAYRLMELQRWRLARDLPLNLNPVGRAGDTVLADKVAIAIQQAGLSPQAYLGAAHRAFWAENRTLSDEAEITRLLRTTGYEADLLAAAKSAEVAAEFAANRDWATSNGVFGAPSYVLDGEIFWGQDRLDLLEAMLASGRPAFRADAAGSGA